MQEKHTAPTLTGLWKLPTGFIQEVCFFVSFSFELCLLPGTLTNFHFSNFCFAYIQSEEIFTGAVREVKEETGVRTLYIVPLIHILAQSCSVYSRACVLLFMLQIDTEFIEVVAFRYKETVPSSEIILITYYQ